MTSRAVILDRDGVLTVPVWDKERGEQTAPLEAGLVRLHKGAADALKLLRQHSWKIAVASNQPDAAKGYAQITDLARVHTQFLSLLALEGAWLDGWRYCYHHPQGTVVPWSWRCDCRKPRPGMLYGLAYEMKIDLMSSWMVGDSDKDINAGEAAGCRTILIENAMTKHRRTGASNPDLRAKNLAAAAAMITSIG